MLRRLPVESTQPVFALALIRLGTSVGLLLLTIVLGFPFEGRLATVLLVAAVPWSLFQVWLARRSPELALSWLVPVGDIAVLLAIELAVPEAYGVVRFVALFFIAVHAHFQGERRGFPIAVGAVAALVVASSLRGGDRAVSGDLLVFYEFAFAAAALGSSLLVGRLRTTESASRLRARSLTRRTLEAEREVRRRVAESIHDGPIQDLIGLDMLLSAARAASERGDPGQVDELMGEAHELASRNVQALRDEIVDLGPYAFEELGYDTAVTNCAPTWQRRYGLEVLLQLERLEMPAEMAADLFAITQEAVTNAGRHAGAKTASISLRSLNGDVELRVMDDGRGFGDVDPLAPGEPGHLGLASMRERAELLDGELTIESSDRGTKVVVLVPLTRRGLLGRRARALR
jgi:two-component system, NarL family, sensor kinase